MRLYRYYVTGRGAFPYDMLRYDQAKIVHRIEREDRSPIYLIEGRTPPTVGRWQSFLWVVINTPTSCDRFEVPVVTFERSVKASEIDDGMGGTYRPGVILPVEDKT